MTNNVDLTVIKRLVAELEGILTRTSKIDLEAAGGKVEYTIEMNKAAGLTAGMMAESGLLMGDIHHAIQKIQGPSKNDALSKILGSLKPSEDEN